MSKMKKVFSILCALVLTVAGAWAQGQGSGRGKENGWRERVRSEKVAFMTREIDLTESEAQVFWPVYNQIQKEQREAFEASKQAYEAMEKGIQEGKTGKEMEKLVKAYIDAKEKNDGFETRSFNKLMKVLPAEKVARYYVAEEKFRHQQIGRLGNGEWPNFKMSEEKKQQWKERGRQIRDQFKGRRDQDEAPAEAQ